MQCIEEGQRHSRDNRNIDTIHVTEGVCFIVDEMFFFGCKVGRFFLFLSPQNYCTELFQFVVG